MAVRAGWAVVPPVVVGDSWMVPPLSTELVIAMGGGASCYCSIAAAGGALETLETSETT